MRARACSLTLSFPSWESGLKSIVRFKGKCPRVCLGYFLFCDLIQVTVLRFQVFAVGAGCGVFAGACDLGGGGEIMTGVVMPRGEQGFPGCLVWVGFAVGQGGGMGIERGTHGMKLVRRG